MCRVECFILLKQNLFEVSKADPMGGTYKMKGKIPFIERKETASRKKLGKRETDDNHSTKSKRMCVE